jgi:hypothetical protein
MKREAPIYGLLAEFDQADDLIAAANRTREAGYKCVDGYTPYPVHGLASAVGHPQTRLPFIVLAGGLFGCFGGFMLQYWYSVIDYPMNIGGRPMNSWPAFVIITFECTILCAALSAVFGMLALNNLPLPYHPLFNVPQFELASRTHFFLAVEAKDPKFDLDETRRFLQSLGPRAVIVVPTGRVKPVRTKRRRTHLMPPQATEPPQPHASGTGDAARHPTGEKV